MPDRIVRFVLTGDNRGAVRAMEGTAVASERTGRSLDKTGRIAKDGQKHVHGFGAALGGLKFAGATVGVGALVYGIKGAVKAGMTWQVQQAQLRNSLRNTGQYSVATMREINKAAEESATHGGFAATTQIQGITRFITELGNSKRAVQANSAVTDVARKLNVDYQSALSIVARAQVGATGRLQQYLRVIIPVTSHVRALQTHTKEGNRLLKEQAVIYKATHPHVKLLSVATNQVSEAALAHAKTLDKQATAAMVNARIVKLLGGATEAYSKTTAGQLENFRNQTEILKEKLGDRLLPLVNKVVKAMSDVLGFFEHHKTAAKATAIAIGVLAASYVTLRIASAAAAISARMSLVKTFLGFGPTALVAGEEAGASFATGVRASSGRWSAAGGFLGKAFGVAAAAVIAQQVDDALINMLPPGSAKKSLQHEMHRKGGGLLALSPIYQLGPGAEAAGETHAQIMRNRHKPGAWFYAAGNRARSMILPHGHQVWQELHSGHWATIRRMAAGGFVGGHSQRDTVPAMLTPGEFVLRKDVVDAIGARNLDAINSGRTSAPGASGEFVLHHKTYLGQRVLAEEVTRFVLRAQARR